MTLVSNVFVRAAAAASVVVVLVLSPVIASAQRGTLEQRFPELAKIYRADAVTLAAVYDAVAEINAAAETQQAQQDLRKELAMIARMTMSEMMQAGMGHGGMMMGMAGPYGELETEARAELGDTVRGDYSDRDVRRALQNVDAITNRAAAVLQAGRDFEVALYDLFADQSLSLGEKSQRADVLVDDYLAQGAAAVSAEPKEGELYLSHDYSMGFRSAFPRINGLMWSNQWIKLASMEAMILEQIDEQFAGGIELTVERYWNKVGVGSGMSMFPAPTELPSVPAISPHLYTLAPRAAVVIDNLNMMKSAIADIVAYPAQTGRIAAIDAVVTSYTQDGVSIAKVEDYLLTALRGGIFNQGGPALGELGDSERNRSREMMNMQHTMIMNVPGN